MMELVIRLPSDEYGKTMYQDGLLYQRLQENPDACYIKMDRRDKDTSRFIFNDTEMEQLFVDVCYNYNILPYKKYYFNMKEIEGVFIKNPTDRNYFFKDEIVYDLSTSLKDIFIEEVLWNKYESLARLNLSERCRYFLESWMYYDLAKEENVFDYDAHLSYFDNMRREAREKNTDSLPYTNYREVLKEELVPIVQWSGPCPGG